MKAEEKSRVLIVDDERLNIKLLGETLSPEYDVIVATNGEQALARASAEPPPALILLDVRMPEMDGFEVCRRLKAGAATREIPVIFITALDTEADENRGFELGGADYITKPFRPLTVLARVKTHLDLTRLREQLAHLDADSR